MTTSKTTDLSVKTQPQSVELLTERLNTIQKNVNKLLNILHGTKAAIGMIATLQALDKKDQIRFNSNDIEVLLNTSKKDLIKTIETLIDIDDLSSIG